MEDCSYLDNTIGIHSSGSGGACLETGGRLIIPLVRPETFQNNHGLAIFLKRLNILELCALLKRRFRRSRKQPMAGHSGFARKRRRMPVVESMLRRPRKSNIARRLSYRRGFTRTPIWSYITRSVLRELKRPFFDVEFFRVEKESLPGAGTPKGLLILR